MIWTESNDPSISGDKVVIDYIGKINGHDFENNSQQDFTFIINDRVRGDEATVNLFNEFYKSCINKKIDDNVEVSHKMPENFPDKTIRGKKVVYSITMKKILKGKRPELNNNFFRMLGIDTDDLEIFKNGVKKHMQYELADKLISVKFGVINKELLNIYKFAISKDIINEHKIEISNQYKNMKKEIDEDTQKKIDQIASDRARLNIIYMRLSQEVNSSISDKDAMAFCEKQSPSFQNFYAEKIKKNKNILEDIKNKMVENAIIEFVISKSSVENDEKKFSEVINV